MRSSSVSLLIETWFSKHARNFPWRKNSTPWGRLVSEFMAQQTQIDRVAERWATFMDCFPTPKSLAESNEQNVLVLWQGLGYYRRARFLKQAAEMIVSEFGGVVPSSVKDLQKLQGVGRYTAGAVASIAFNHPAPIVDANVHRVLCRLFNYDNDPVPCDWTWEHAEQLVINCNSPQNCNEGLIELGATICVPKKPKCDVCPIQKYCLANKAGTQTSVPPPKPPTKKTILFHYSVIMKNGKSIAFEQRDQSGLWGGMWQVPTIEATSQLNVNEITAQLGFDMELKKVGSFKHVLTHRIIEFQVYSCDTKMHSKFDWHPRDEIKNIPLANAQRKVLATQP